MSADAFLAANGNALAQQSSPPSSGIDRATARGEPNQQPTPPAGAEMLAGSPALQRLIYQALEHNPEIEAMQRRFDMMRARIPQAKALDEPVLSIGYMGNLIPFQVQKGDPSSGRRSASARTCPFPANARYEAR